MMISRNKMSCAELRQIDMVHYLSVLGFEPSKIKGNVFWYCSPLRDEKTASFKVNRTINLWYDHGIGKGGNLIDFALLFYGCTVKELLQMNGDVSTFQQRKYVAAELRQADDPKIEILSEKKISSPDLLLYLTERKISVSIASQYCAEIGYCFAGRKYIAIGFKNDLGGYELRNRYFKGGSSPKAITSINSGAQKLCVFEGFFDFLSYIALNEDTEEDPADFLILNSLSFLSDAILSAKNYSNTQLFFDHDDAGRKASLCICADNNDVVDQSYTYHNYKDLNEFLKQTC